MKQIILHALHWLRRMSWLFPPKPEEGRDGSTKVATRKILARPRPLSRSAPLPTNVSIFTPRQEIRSAECEASSSSKYSARAKLTSPSDGNGETRPTALSVVTDKTSLIPETAAKSAQRDTAAPFIPILQAVGGLEVPQLTLGGYGAFGGRFAPEAIMGFLCELTSCFEATVADPAFWSEHDRFHHVPTSLQKARNLTSLAGGATIWLKREDENDYGSHKARNITGQLLLAKRMGRQEVVTDCACAKHGSFTAAMCARLGLRCVVVMGTDDANAQHDDVVNMELLGARVLTTRTPSGMGSLRAAIAEALRYAICKHDSTYYLMGSPVGPSPLPAITRTFQSLLGQEVAAQLQAAGVHPDALVTAIGSGSGAVGLFQPFLQDNSVRLVGVEAARAAVLTNGEVGVLHGACTLLLQSQEGQVLDSYSISPDMNLSTVGPEVAYWKKAGRIEVSTASDEDAISGLKILSHQEEISAGLDSCHAVNKTLDLAKSLGPGKNVVLVVTGHDNIAIRGGHG